MPSKNGNPDADHAKLHDWCRNLYEDGKSARAGYEAQWWENVATFMGDFWVDFDVALNKLVEPAAPDHRVRIPINLAMPAVRTEYAKLLKNRPMVDCLARSNEKRDLDSAEVGDKLLYHYIEKQLHLPRYRRRMLQWVVITGLGGLFVDYDPKALGEQSVLVDNKDQPVFDERMIASIQRHYRDKKKAPKTKQIPQGELRHVALSPWQFMWDRSKLDFDEAWWVIISEVYDVDDVYRRWGVEVDAGKNPQPGMIERRTIERMDLTKKVDYKPGDTQKLVEIHRMFVRPGHRYFPQGAEIVFHDRDIIEKTNFPRKHGLLPLGICGHIPAPWSQHTLSILPQIKPQCLEVSKTYSQMIENRNMMANPPWVEYKQNRIEGEIQNKPGMRLQIEYMPNVPEPHPIEMPELPQYVKELIPITKENINEISGQSEVSQGKVPAGARAGVTIAYLQEEDDTKLGPTVQEYEECMERVAWLDLQTIAEEYDAPRTIRIYKPHSDPEVFDFIGTMLEGVAGVVVQAGSALPRSKAAKQQFMLDLWDRGIEQDPRKIRQWLELNEGDPDEFEKDIQQAERENRKMLNGEEVEVKEWQNHPAHHYVHRSLMKSLEFEEADAAIQELLETHDEEHTAWEQQQQAQQMASQAMAGTQATPPAAGGNGQTATPQPPFASATPFAPNGNGASFAPPENGQTGAPAPFSPA